jgi:hypothetical protein
MMYNSKSLHIVHLMNHKWDYTENWNRLSVNWHNTFNLIALNTAAFIKFQLLEVVCLDSQPCRSDHMQQCDIASTRHSKVYTKRESKVRLQETYIIIDGPNAKLSH